MIFILGSLTKKQKKKFKKTCCKIVDKYYKNIKSELKMAVIRVCPIKAPFEGSTVYGETSHSFRYIKINKDMFFPACRKDIESTIVHELKHLEFYLISKAIRKEFRKRTKVLSAKGHEDALLNLYNRTSAVIFLTEHLAYLEQFKHEYRSKVFYDVNLRHYQKYSFKDLDEADIYLYEMAEMFAFSKTYGFDVENLIQIMPECRQDVMRHLYKVLNSPLSIDVLEAISDSLKDLYLQDPTWRATVGKELLIEN